MLDLLFNKIRCIFKTYFNSIHHKLLKLILAALICIIYSKYQGSGIEFQICILDIGQAPIMQNYANYSLDWITY